jgi:protein regulator of cytokinesis 1
MNGVRAGVVCLFKDVLLWFWQGERLHKVLEYVNLMHELCSVMGMDFFKIVTEVHPSLDDSQGIPKSISNETLDRLAKTIYSLQAEKNNRVIKVHTNFADFFKWF